MMRSLLHFLRQHKGLAAVALLASVCTLLAGIGLMSSSAFLISWAAKRPPILDLILVIVAVRFFALSRAGFRYLERLVSHDLTFRWLMQIRLHLYRILVPRMPALLLRTPSGDLLTRLGQDVDTLQNLYLRVAAPAIAAAIVVLITLAGLSFFAAPLALVALLFLTLNGVAVPALAVRQSRGMGQAQIAARSALASDLVESLQGMSDLLMLNQEGAAKQRLAQRDRALAGAQRQQARITAAQDAASFLCAHLGMAMVLITAIPLINSGQINGIFLALLTLGVLTSFEAVQSLGTAFQFHEQTQTAAGRLDEIERNMPLPPEPQPSNQPASNDILFENVSFAYDPQPTLNGISLSIPAGQRIGLIGPSGAGKSTMASLLLRFLNADAGQITLGGCDVQTCHAEGIRTRFAVIPQQVYLFNQTLRANLLLACPKADEERIWHALEQSRLAEWVRSLPEGLDTWIQEQGANVSGGERQRVAIARALLKDAPIWIFDEPTAHLDTRTEQAVVETLLSVSTGRSLLWISHRLAGLDQLDHLYVLVNGCIREHGTHTQLVEQNDYYARMLRLQHQSLATEESSSS